LYVRTNLLCQTRIVQKIDHILPVLHPESTVIVILFMVRNPVLSVAAVNTERV
jgi:hypothetical protein